MRTFLFTLLFLLSINNAYCQLEWAPIGTQWYYSHPHPWSGNPFWRYDLYTSEKDTLINDKSCRVIRCMEQTEYMLLEDSIVYYYLKGEFHPLYDFSKQVGDTSIIHFKGYNVTDTIDCAYDTFYVARGIIERIDTIYANDLALRSFLSRIEAIDTSPSVTELIWPGLINYIERIGVPYMFMPMVELPSLGHMRHLRCYSDNDINYMNPWWAQHEKPCDYEIPDAIEENKLSELSIFPNPSTGKITISMDQTTSISNILVYTATGNRVYQKTSKQNPVVIDLSHLQSGIYYLGVILESGFQEYHKIIMAK